MGIDSFAAYDIALNNYDFDRIVAGHPSVRSDSLLSSLNPFLAPGVKVSKSPLPPADFIPSL
jgi:hypothetical protein